MSCYYVGFKTDVKQIALPAGLDRLHLLEPGLPAAAAFPPLASGHLGHGAALQAPVSRTLTMPSVTSTSSISPPSRCSMGRILVRACSTAFFISSTDNLQTNYPLMIARQGQIVKWWQNSGQPACPKARSGLTWKTAWTLALISSSPPRWQWRARRGPSSQGEVRSNWPGCALNLILKPSFRRLGCDDGCQAYRAIYYVDIPEQYME